MTGLTDRQGASFSFTYDANQNQLTAVETATNQTVTFSYSPRGLLSQATDALGASESFTYDAAANLTQRDDTVAGQNFTTTFDHTPRNQVKTVTRGSDTSSFSYDASGRLTVQNAVKDALSLNSFAQSYDAAGNITQLTENGTLTTNYGYDELNRLTSENISGYGNISYSYDAAGNRLTLDNPTTGHSDYSYNQANQLTGQVTGSITTAY